MYYVELVEKTNDLQMSLLGLQNSPKVTLAILVMIESLDDKCNEKRIV